MDIRAVLLGVTFAIIWASAFTSARIIVEGAPPLWALTLRYAFSGAVAVGLAWALGQRIRLTAAQWRGVVIFGICQNALYLGLNFVAIRWGVEAGLATIIASTMPLMVAAISWGFFRERLPKLGIMGLLAGFLGVALIMGQRLEAGAYAPGVVLCVLGAAALTIATLTVRTTNSGDNLLMIVGLQILIGGVALLPFAALFEPFEATLSPALIAAFLYTCFVPGILATFIWFVLVRRIGATRAATFHFLNPVFGVVIAWIILGEALRVMDFVGVVIIAGGILAVQMARATPHKNVS